MRQLYNVQRAPEGMTDLDGCFEASGGTEYENRGRNFMSFTTREKYQLYINGTWTEPLKSRYRDIINPSTGKLLCSAASSSEADVDKAVQAAAQAFPVWKKTTPVERQNALLKIAALIEENLEYLAWLVSTEMGMPKESSLHLEVPGAADHFRYFAGCVRAEEGNAAVIDPTQYGITIREPLGVCGLIVPWNFPLGIGSWKLAPALAAGNTIVFKPSINSPVSILELARLIDEAQVLPPGVLNIVTGSGSECGEALAKNPGIAKISLTGSVEAGRKVLHNAAETITPATMELGGKSPNIIFSDCNMDQAVEGAVIALGIYNQGEVCSAGTRAFVHNDIHDEFVSRLCALLEKQKVGPAWDDNTGMGPIVSKSQLEKIENYIRIGIDEGANLRSGGKRPEDPELKDGYYIQPTLFTEVKNSMTIAREEIFGPVLAVIPFSTEEEAIAMANDNDYGLGAGVWTQDINRAIRVSRALESGKVWVNTYDQVPAHVPFGGCKLSGYGRETHKMALDEYSYMKNIFIETSGQPYGFYPE